MYAAPAMPVPVVAAPLPPPPMPAYIPGIVDDPQTYGYVKRALIGKRNKIRTNFLDFYVE